MGTPRSFPDQANSNKMLWTGVAVVLIIVLAMGVTLMRRQTQPQVPHQMALPTMEAPPSTAPPATASLAAEARTAAAPLPPASAATDPRVDTPKPRIVQPRTSEPAVARAPQRVVSEPGAVESGTLPDVNR
jgi:hypothetical protein